MATTQLKRGDIIQDIHDARLPSSLGSAGQVLAMNDEATGITWKTGGTGSGNVDDVKVNGTSVVDADKVAQVTVPTKTSDIANDSGYIDNTYHDNTKVDVVEGKGLSTNDYDNIEKQKVTDSYNVKHEHSNKSVLDSITSSLTSEWSEAATWVDNYGAPVVSAENTGGIGWTKEASTETISVSWDEVTTGLPVISAGLAFTSHYKLSHDSLVRIINNLQTVTTTAKLNLGTANLWKLSAEEIAVATNKGWTVV